MFRIPVHREHWFLEGRTYKKRNRIGGENLIVNWAGGIHRTIDRVVREIQENLGKCSIIHKHLKFEKNPDGMFSHLGHAFKLCTV